MHQEIHKHIELLVFELIHRNSVAMLLLFSGQIILPYHHTQDQTKHLTFIPTSFLKSMNKNEVIHQKTLTVVTSEKNLFFNLVFLFPTI